MVELLSFNMAYNYNSRRQIRKLSRQSRRNFIVTLFLIVILLYVTLVWILPFIINGTSIVKNFFHPSKKITNDISTNSTLAPPILNIPYEATKTAQINITGYGSPNSKVAIYLDDDKKNTVDVSTDGAFEFKNISLVLGTNNIFGKSIDDKNFESLPSKKFQITYDNVSPSLNISEPEDGKKIQGGDKKIKIAGNTEPGVQVFVNDSQVIVDRSGNFSLELPLNEGDNDFNIKAQDTALNFTEISRKVIYNP